MGIIDIGRDELDQRTGRRIARDNIRAMPIAPLHGQRLDIESQSRLAFTVAVTGVTVLFENGANILYKIDRRILLRSKRRRSTDPHETDKPYKTDMPHEPHEPDKEADARPGPCLCLEARPSH
jgi:ribosomal protein S3